MCAVTTSVSVSAGRNARYSASAMLVFASMRVIDGKSPDSARTKIRMYATKNSGNEIEVSAIALAARSKIELR